MKVMEKERVRTRHEWLRPGSLLLVFFGGCFGAAAREALGAAIPPGSPIPIGILIANLLGAFLLGLLLEWLSRQNLAEASPESARRGARMRLLLGTGVLGGFTTYSALALAVVALLHGGSIWLGIAYGLGTLLLGALTTFAGIALAAAMHARRGGTSGGSAGGSPQRPAPSGGADA